MYFKKDGINSSWWGSKNHSKPALSNRNMPATQILFKFSNSHIKKVKLTSIYFIYYIYSIILMCNWYTVLVRYFKLFHITPWNPTCALYFKYISVMTSHVSSAQQPHVASGYQAGQCHSRWSNLTKEIIKIHTLITVMSEFTWKTGGNNKMWRKIEVTFDFLFFFWKGGCCFFYNKNTYTIYLLSIKRNGLLSPKGKMGKVVAGRGGGSQRWLRELQLAKL